MVFSARKTHSVDAKIALFRGSHCYVTLYSLFGRLNQRVTKAASYSIDRVRLNALTLDHMECSFHFRPINNSIDTRFAILQWWSAQVKGRSFKWNQSTIKKMNFCKWTVFGLTSYNDEVKLHYAIGLSIVPCIPYRTAHSEPFSLFLFLSDLV